MGTANAYLADMEGHDVVVSFGLVQTRPGRIDSSIGDARLRG